MEEIKLHQFAEKLTLRGYSKRCVKDYPWNVKQFFRYLTDKESIQSLNDVKPAHIQAYHTDLVYGKNRALATASIKARLLSVKTFYRIMFEEKLIKQDYAPLITVPKRRKHLPRHVPSEKDMAKLLEAITPMQLVGVRDRALLELLYATGLRNEEVRTIILENMDMQEKTLFITGKGSKDRIVPIGDWVMPYLREYIEAARPKLVRQPIELLFVSKNGRMITQANLNDLIKKYAKRAGLVAAISPHSFRHACATHLLKGGADIRYVQELLGHSDLSSTQVYTKIDISFLKQAHKAYHPRERAVNG